MAKLLIVDDDQQTCEYLKEFFEQRKCVVSMVNSGEDAIDHIKQDKPNIVLLDVRMKGMDGLQTLTEIKKIDKEIKVIIITVATDEQTQQRAQELGADDFIKKPLNTSYLEGTVSLKVSNLTKPKDKE